MSAITYQECQAKKDHGLLCGNVAEFPNPGGIAAADMEAPVCRSCLAEDVVRRLLGTRRPFTKQQIVAGILNFMNVVWAHDETVPGIDPEFYVDYLADDLMSVMRVTKE